MGCSGSKDRPAGGQAPQSRQNPPPHGGTYQHGGQGGYNQGGYQGGAVQYSSPPPQGQQYHQQDYRNQQRSQREQREVDAAILLVSQNQANQGHGYNNNNSYQQQGHYQSPPPSQAPGYRPPQEEEEDGPLVTPRENHHKTNEILELQQYASLEQLSEVYPNVDRKVIKGILEDCGGNMENAHNVLQELSPAPGAPGHVSPPAARDPVPLVTEYHENDAVDAMFQGQWFPAVIVCREANGDYNVKWTEDGTQTLVTADQLRTRGGPGAV